MKTLMCSIVLYVLLTSLNAWATADTLTMEDNENLILKEKNSSTGIYDDDYETTKDDSRLSFLYRTNANLKKMDGLSSYEIAYAKKIDLFWGEFFLSQTAARFETITTQNENIEPYSADKDQSNTKLTSFGAGFSLRSTIVQNILNNVINAERFFETSSADITYNTFTSDYSSKFSGYGFRADYGIHYRAYPSFHIGPHFNYNLVAVKKAPEADRNTSSSRTLLLTWTTFGIDLSFYF